MAQVTTFQMLLALLTDTIKNAYNLLPHFQYN